MTQNLRSPQENGGAVRALPRTPGGTGDKNDINNVLKYSWAMWLRQRSTGDPKTRREARARLGSVIEGSAGGLNFTKWKSKPNCTSGQIKIKNKLPPGSGPKPGKNYRFTKGDGRPDPPKHPKTCREAKCLHFHAECGSVVSSMGSWGAKITTIQAMDGAEKRGKNKLAKL